MERRTRRASAPSTGLPTLFCPSVVVCSPKTSRSRYRRALYRHPSHTSDEPVSISFINARFAQQIPDDHPPRSAKTQHGSLADSQRGLRRAIDG